MESSSGAPGLCPAPCTAPISGRPQHAGRRRPRSPQCPRWGAPGAEAGEGCTGPPRGPQALTGDAAGVPCRASRQPEGVAGVLERPRTGFSGSGVRQAGAAGRGGAQRRPEQSAGEVRGGPGRWRAHSGTTPGGPAGSGAPRGGTPRDAHLSQLSVFRVLLSTPSAHRHITSYVSLRL